MPENSDRSVTDGGFRGVINSEQHPTGKRVDRLCRASRLDMRITNVPVDNRILPDSTPI
jgi:hypothetical protein